MAVYELVCVFSPKIKDRKKLIEKVEGWLKEIGAKIEKKKDWGRKDLAYPIGKHSQGDYFYWLLEAKAAKINELSGKVKLETEVIRSLLVRTD